MPVALAVVGAATGIAGAVAGGVAKAGVAKSQAEQAAADRASALQYAAPTSQELQSINDRLQQQTRYQAVQEAALDRDSQILSSLDPALISAGQQANQMLQGKQAEILAPMKQQQDFQRKQLEQKLAAQFGPGYASSSAGQQALQQFDMNSNLSLQGAQMQAFNQISQFMGFNLGQRTAMQAEERQAFRTGSEMSAETLRGMGDIQKRQASAVLGTSKEMVGSAGSQYAPLAAFGEIAGGVGKGLTGLGGTMMGEAMGNMQSASAMTSNEMAKRDRSFT